MEWSCGDLRRDCPFTAFRSGLGNIVSALYILEDGAVVIISSDNVCSGNICLCPLAAVYLSLVFPLNWILIQDKGLILAIFIFKYKPSVLICKF